MPCCRRMSPSEPRARMSGRYADVARAKFRLERCHSTDIHLSVTSIPVIEESDGLRFAGYPSSVASQLPSPLPPQVSYHPSDIFGRNPTLTGTRQSRHAEVKDFSWIRATPSPNWSPVSEQDGLVNWIQELERTRTRAADESGKGGQWVADAVDTLRAGRRS